MLDAIKKFKVGELKQVKTKEVKVLDLFHFQDKISETEHIFSEDELSKCEIDLAAVKIIKELGRGAQGVVLKGQLYGQDVAVKKLHHCARDLTPTELALFRQEVAIMRQIRHPKVVQFMGASTKGDNLMLVTEFIPRGDLEHVLMDKSVHLSFFTRMKMALDIAIAMTWLHNTKPVFIHRDLKTSNILVDNDYSIKICDFGLTHVKRNVAGAKGHYGLKGTPYTIAPEVFRQDQYGEKSDIYSFSIVLWELLTRSSPYDEKMSADEIREFVLAGGRPTIPASCPPRLRALIQSCWDNDGDVRPPFQTIVEELTAVLIPDDALRLFWATNLLGEFYVQVDKFRSEVALFLQITESDDRLDYLIALLEPSGGLVSMEKFVSLLSWFGPLASAEEEPTFLDQLNAVCTKPWFHGNLSKEETVEKLQNQPPGTFLVRFSADPGCYVIGLCKPSAASVPQKTQSQISLLKVSLEPSGAEASSMMLVLGNVKGKTITELVDQCIEAEVLVSPCPYCFLDKLPKKEVVAYAVFLGIPTTSTSSNEHKSN
jgi:serine/threonine protein kinase